MSVSLLMGLGLLGLMVVLVVVLVIVLLISGRAGRQATGRHTRSAVQGPTANVFQRGQA